MKKYVRRFRYQQQGKQMKKNRITMCLALAAMAIGFQAQAQDSMVQHVLDSCEVEIESFCSQVTPGGGRLLHCAAAHEDKLSGRCNYALFQASSALQQIAAAVAHVAEQCMTDVQTLCGDVKEGEGRILMCLDENAEAVSDNCKQARTDVGAD
jgi:hypothetical protein